MRYSSKEKKMLTEERMMTWDNIISLYLNLFHNAINEVACEEGLEWWKQELNLSVDCVIEVYWLYSNSVAHFHSWKRFNRIEEAGDRTAAVGSFS